MTTTNEIQTTDAGSDKPSVIRALAARFNVEPRQMYAVLKETIAPKATDAQLAAFCIVCHEYGLNPITKEIYAFPGKGGEIVPMVGIDGWIHLMNAHPQYDGLQVDMSDDGSACTARIYRKDRAHPVEVTEYLEECKRGTEPWRQSPRRMLRHKAIIQAARVAFGFSGIYDEDDAREVAGAAPRAAVGRVVPSATEAAASPLRAALPKAKPASGELFEMPEETAATVAGFEH